MISKIKLFFEKVWFPLFLLGLGLAMIFFPDLANDQEFLDGRRYGLIKSVIKDIWGLLGGILFIFLALTAAYFAFKGNDSEE